MNKNEFINNVINSIDTNILNSNHIKSYDINISYNSDFFVITITVIFKYNNNKTIITCGFGGGGYFLNNFTMQSDDIINILKTCEIAY